MKRSIFKAIANAILILALLAGWLPAQAQAAQQPPAVRQDNGSRLDPEPPAAPAPVTPDPSAVVAPQATLELAWTAPVAYNTNALAWGDYDVDGDLDLLVGTYGKVHVYTNLSGVLTDTLTLICDPAATVENTYSVSWGDPNRDGYLDIAVGNTDSANCFYRYDPAGHTFVRAWVAGEIQSTRSVAWAGWLLGSSPETFLAVGNYSEPSAVYRYEAGQLETPIWQGPIGLNTNSLAWGDYDDDGYPDLAMGNFAQSNLIYHNDGTTLTPVYTTTEQSYTWSVAWGDMNGDGHLDLAVGNTRSLSTVHPNQVYCNSGEPSYTFALCWTSADLIPTHAVAWGDYDGDGDLDLVASSETSGSADQVTRIYLNTGGSLGSSPAVSFSTETSKSRAVAWADWDGDSDLELTIGYYGGNNMLYNNTAGTLKRNDLVTTPMDTRSLAWGDYDRDGDLDLAVGNSSGGQNQIYAATPSGLSFAWNAPVGENTRSLAWGDFDGDGWLDLAVGNGQANRIYHNTNGVLADYDDFSDSTPADTYAVGWGDFDNDGDLDLAEANYNTDLPDRIFINNGGVFTHTLALPDSEDNSLSLSWGDADQDYLLDLAVGNQYGPSRVYQNWDGTVFHAIDLPLPTSPCIPDARSIAWADWDRDGDLDLAIGNGGGTGCIQLIETTVVSGTLSFAQAWQSTEAEDIRSLAWGDYNGDGWLDLAVGITGQSGGRNKIYRNAVEYLTPTWLAPSGDADPTRSVAWGDFDNDGDLDLAVGNTYAQNRLYVNHRNGSINLANDPTYAVLQRPGSTANAWYFSTAEIIGSPVLDLEFELVDDEYDAAFRIEPQVSWDGGGKWEPAWVGEGGSGTTNLAGSPNGTPHVFVWNALQQLLSHQQIPFDPENDVYVPFFKSDEEMDVAFRIQVWSTPQHGGLVQRPAFGSATDQFRLDVRPDWVFSQHTADPDVVHPGEVVDYSILITQTDHGMPDGGYVLDYLPDGLTIVGDALATTGGITWTQNMISWTGALPYQEELWLDYSAQVTRPYTNGLELDNCANVYDGLHEPFDLCTTVTISSTPVLEMSEKWVNGVSENIADPGDVLTYTILLTNTGTDNARDAVLTDMLDEDLTWGHYLVASSGQIAIVNGVITWQGDINVFEPVFITYTADVNSPLPGNSVITNTFQVDDGVNPLFVSAPVTTTVSAPDLRQSVKVASPGQVEIGDMITYTIVISNVGAYAADPATLDDPIPDGCQYVPGSLEISGGIGNFDAAQQAITWTNTVELGDIFTITFQITAGMPNLPPEPQIDNVAILFDPVGGNTPLVATTQVLLPDLSSSHKQAEQAGVQLGQQITYTLNVNNTGGYGPGLHLDDPLPANSTYIPGSFSATSGAGGYFAGSDLIYWDGDLDAGGSVDMTFAIVAGCPISVGTALIENEATAYNTVGFPTMLTAQTPIFLPSLTSSSLDADVSTVHPGDLINYTLMIANTGGDAPRVWMIDQLPSNVEWTGVYEVSYGTLQYSPTTRQVRWDGINIGPGSSVTIIFQVRVRTVGYGHEVDNTAQIFYDCDSTEVNLLLPVVSYQLFLPAIAK